MVKRTLFAIVCLLFCLIGTARAIPAESAPPTPVKIGVLAHRGAAAAHQMWDQTAEYLSSNIPRHAFTIVPLSFAQLAPAVARGEIDFVLANSSIYVELEARYGVTRIATMVNDGRQGDQTRFGGVIFCRADRHELNTIDDLHGKSFLAVDETSLGGWQVAWRELKANGLDPARDFRRLRFANTTHDAVVYAIRDGQADAGTVRTDTLERLAAEGKIELGAFRIINPQHVPGFPFLLSTRLYPEWPLAALAQTRRNLAEQVTVALLKMPPESPLTRAAQITGWTIPLDYQPVHELMQELRLEPYQDYGKITPAQVVRRYWPWLLLGLTALLNMTALAWHVSRLNRRLVHAKERVEEARNGLEQEVQTRTAELQMTNWALACAEDAAQQHALALERLLDVSRESTKSTDPTALYRLFCLAANDLLKLDFSTLLLLSADQKTMTVRDTIGFPESIIGTFSLTEGQGLTSLTVKSKKVEVVLDFTRENRFAVSAIVFEHGIHSALAVPMLMPGELIGVLIGHTCTRREFSPPEQELYQLLANQAAVAIRNALNTEMLKKSEKYIREVTAALGEGVYVLNALGNVTFMNPEAESLLGWREAELLHDNIHERIHPQRGDGSPLPFADCEIRKVFESGQIFRSEAEVFTRRDGTTFPVAVSSTPLFDDGKIVASVTAFRDISARLQLENEREKLVADLQQALAQIKTLHGIVPICASCKKIRDDAGAWHQMEVYISQHTDAQFSHGICKDCARKLYPEYYHDDKSGVP